ncbi:SAM-dependent methyltransferase [Pseudomonas sp. N3-W]|uniref:SAM-dependent methyltransferase n=1 Tax=Pseudomonas fungipugnans TaxID=3024217 RepID=A0ABT6QHG9_9PSED|nr:MULTISPECIES: SAM-dependent methyltransferase [unclassified Pseudomonas]MDI2590330.1 SAM-dependent methyltransferase [Pseudomonas sp. 681]UWF52023.1 SAM-dependent methyltransferase [Pseudomonas sp. N3-W]
MSMITPRPHTPEQAYPDVESHRRRWRQLARAIAARGPQVTDDVALLTPPTRPGTLEILGSGIEASGFTRSDEARIDAADHVFYCVADPATKIWILSRRPDAYDLYVLYDDSKPRYLTYMQMTEAMLHYVREGAHVVAIFYGHPGVFVLSTHRAVTIARREGHQATMRAAVSALDTLCADLGVDPSQPGMQMYEATDMLIRRRQPDPGLHLVLWQVGLIGELGYRRQGYLNSNFAVLLDYLEALYGPDHPVINYVGSRYPGIDPLIDHQTLASLRDPLAQSWVTGISTFYLPPRSAGQSDPAMLERLGLIRPGQPVRAATEPLRVIDRYDKRERRAFSDFAGFDVPASYQWQPDTAAGRFVLALSDDAPLRQHYREDPQAALLAWGGGLDARERHLLAQRDPGAVQLAAKGTETLRHPGNREALEHLLTYSSATAALSRASNGAAPGTLRSTAAAWSRKAGLTVDWPRMTGELGALLQSSLAPWTGFYMDSARQLTLSVFCRIKNAGLRMDLNGQRLIGVRYQGGVLTWKAEAGNPSSGYLQSDLSVPGLRSWIGLIWPLGEAAGSQYKVALRAQSLARPACLAVGDYRVKGSTLRIVPEPLSGQGVAILRDGQPLNLELAFNGRETQAGELRLPLSARRIDQLPDWARGDYRLRLVHGRLAEMLTLHLADGRLEVGGVAVTLSLEGGRIVWRDGPAALASGELEIVLDPITLRPLLHGDGRSAAGNPIRLRGMALLEARQIDPLLANPRFGLPDWAWEHLVGLMVEASDKGGVFLWHGYDRARNNLRLLRQVLERLRQDETEAL